MSNESENIEEEASDPNVSEALIEETAEPDVHEVEGRESKHMALSRLYGLHKRGRLATDTYQRNFVDRKSKWNTKLIESVLCGIDIGSVELVKATTEDGEMYYIVDGQHRILTIMRYLDNEFTLAKNHLTKVNSSVIGQRFQKLGERWQNKLQDTEVTAFMYRENEHHDAASIFLRRNEGSSNLNKMERYNARWCRSIVYRALWDLVDVREEDSTDKSRKDMNSAAMQWQGFALSNNKRLESLRVLLEFVKDIHHFDNGEDITKGESEVKYYEDELHAAGEKEIKTIQKMVKDFLSVWRMVDPKGSGLNKSSYWDCTEESGNKPHRILHPVLTLVIHKITKMGKTDAIAHATDIRDFLDTFVTNNSELFFPVGDTRKFTVDDEKIRHLVHYTLDSLVTHLEELGVNYNIDKPVSPALRKEILNERKVGDHWVCEISGGTLIDDSDIDIDHTVKRSLGGKTTKDNLRIVHKTLNRSQRYNLTQEEE